MNLKDSYDKYLETSKDAVDVKNNTFVITDIDKFKEKIPELIDISKISYDSCKTVFYVMLSAAQKNEIFLSSLHNLYKGKGNGSIRQHFTIPVIDCTDDSLEQVQQILIAQKTIGFQLCCFGLKIDDPNNNPYSFITKILGAALKENYSGSIFLHAGNIKFDNKRFNDNRDKLMDELKEKVKKVINLGFYNLTLDSSELIEENRVEILEKILMNLKMVAMATTLWIRNFEPKGISVAVGGVLRLIEDQSSGATILKEYIKRLLKEESRLRFNTPGEDIIKIGVINENNLNIDSLKLMNTIVINEFQMGGIVLDLGKQNDLTMINEVASDGFCELHFSLSNELKSISNYTSIFSNLVDIYLQNNSEEYLLKRPYIPKFSELQ